MPENKKPQAVNYEQLMADMLICGYAQNHGVTLLLTNLKVVWAVMSCLENDQKHIIFLCDMPFCLQALLAD